LNRRITIITGQHLTANPRVWKEATALASGGFFVTIHTTWYNPLLLTEDKKLIDKAVNYLPSFSLIYSWNNCILVSFARALKKVANYMFKWFKISSIYQEIYLPGIQLKRILNTPADLFICHQEAGLLLGVQLLKKGKKVAFDFEDWYAKDYPNFFRPINLFRENELHALKYAEYVTCPSDSMSIALQQYYKFDRQVSVVYNSFPPGNIQDNHIQKIPNSLVWFSQTVGPNRGIEDFINVLRQLDIPVEIHFIGFSSISYREYLVECLNGTPHKVKIHSLMKHSDMVNFVNQFEYGLALEESFPSNKDLTISNKILLYLQLNLHVIATSTKGHLELKPDFGGSISYIETGKTLANAELIRRILIRGVNKPTIEMGKYQWKMQEQVIRDLVEDALNK
jgi:hypothetical protein